MLGTEKQCNWLHHFLWIIHALCSELFKSSLEPATSSERVNGASFSSVPAHLQTTESISLFKDEPKEILPEKPVAVFHEEKEISLDDDDEPQYEEEKLQVLTIFI